MQTIVCASHNPNKVREIAKITREFGLDVITRDEAGVPLLFDVIEDGKTFADNSSVSLLVIPRGWASSVRNSRSGPAVTFSLQASRK